MIEKSIERAAQLSCFKNPSEITPLGGGITNVNLSLRDGERRYVVRLGNDIPEHGVMRWNELELSKAAWALGVAPAVHHQETGALVLELIEAKTFEESDVRDDNNLTRIIDLVARVHRGLGQYLKTPILTFWPYQVIRTYAKQLSENGSTYTSELSDLLKRAAELEVSTGPVELVVGHNDLLAANILDDGEQLWLIDWEYGGFNSPLFDLAGLAGNNGLSEAQECAMLEQYFNEAADKRWRAYQAMKCASLMRETLWSMTSEIFSEIDFDYAAYTAENMQRLQSALNEFKNS